MAKQIFSSFTNKYSLSKTLRFELIPVGKTQGMLEENHVFQLDKDRQEAYQKTKPYFDRLHRTFVREALKDANIDGLEEYFSIFKEYKKDKDQRKKLDTEKKKLREQIVTYFDANGKEWATHQYSHLKIKKEDLDILFEEQVFQILKAFYGDEPETVLTDKETGESFSIFDGWKGFIGYFKKFFETRKNFYKDDGTSTALATRIIDQNLDRFLDNSIIFQSIKGKLAITEVEAYFELQANEVFSVDFYNTCLLQDGIDTYNDFLGGKTLPNGEKKKGINEIINKYRQDNKGEKLPFLKKLDKQILSEKEKFVDEIETQEELLILLRTFYNSAENKMLTIKTLITHFFNNTDKYDLKGIYLSKEALNTIAYKWTSETDSFNENLYLILREAKIISSPANKKDGDYSFPDFIALDHIKNALENVSTETRFWKDRYYEGNNSVLISTESMWEQFLKIFSCEFLSHFERLVINSDNREQTTIGYDVFKLQFEGLLKNFTIDKDSKVIIKNFADEVLRIYQMAKYFALEKKRTWETKYDDSLDSFYTDPDTGYLKFYETAYEEIVQPYNKIRNYLTKKPYNEDKWKLNFENPTLADGWDKNKEADNTSVILRKEGRYYLGIMKKGCNQIFNDKNCEQFKSGEGEDYYEKLVYKQIANPAFDIYNLILQVDGTVKRATKKETKQKEWPSDVLRIYENKTYAKENFNRQDFEQYIDYLKKCALGYWNDYNLEFSHTSTYKNISDLTRQIDNKGYRVSFERVSKKYVDDKNQSGEFFLFEIHSKDWNEGAKGSKNLHTLYFESLFSDENVAKNFPMKLNGQAEIFYRPKTEKLEKEKIITKEKGITLEKGSKTFHKNRYMENKIFFHVPITLNRIAKTTGRFNTQINDFLADNPDINIIGVDRGEKHLAYYSVINQEGEILDSGSLNTVNEVDYHKKLEQKAEDRKKAREDWQNIEGIKDLKKGYVSQVVRKLADLAIKHNAIIVMEDLNMRFKQIRGGIEKSAYQQLEKALIEKLNFLVNKGEIDPNKAGHLLQAYQLTAPFETFKNMGKQTGIIFYTQASYTSKIDPVTGWRPNMYLKYSNADQAKKEILTFDNIVFNDKQDRFEFTYDIKNFFSAKEFPNKTHWTVCSNVERFKWDWKLNNSKGGYTHYPNLTIKLKELLEAFSIDYRNNIISQIDQMDTKGNEKFFKDFVFYFGLICQIRNTQQNKDGNENDFVLSPVEPFFDSRKASQFGQSLPQNGDDNGALNIARKGIIILNKITGFYHKHGTTEKLSWNDLFVSNTEWDNFVSK